MADYKILEHKADLKIQVWGKTKEELFQNALTGMVKSAQYGFISDSPLLRKEIKISSFDITSLLVDFLTEILFLCETEKIVYYKIKFKNLTDQKLEGILIGQKLKQVGVQIKAVTYHDLIINQDKNGLWQAIILFDI
ncbi:MAG: archease [Minisyncoccales bacterium]